MPKLQSECIEFTKIGDPREVLQLGKRIIDTDAIGHDEVLIRWLASPVNPLDINIVSGTYAYKRQLPAVGGSEGVAIVEQVGRTVRNVVKGDRVISCRSQGEVWSEFSVVESEYLIRILPNIDLVSAATICINPPTAYLMLKSCVDLKRGDYVIQNSSNSGVGRAVIQIAKELGYKTINLVRKRPDWESMKAELRSLGGEYVFSEEEFTPTFSRKFISEIGGGIKLALNGVGGRSALIISSALDVGGTMVTYGGMSKLPSQIATASLVYKNIRAVGIMVNAYLHDDSKLADVREMFAELQAMIAAGSLSPIPARFYARRDFKLAIGNAMNDSKSKRKNIILLQDEESEFYSNEKFNLQTSKI